MTAGTSLYPVQEANFVAGRFVTAAQPDGEIVRRNPARPNELLARWPFSRALVIDAVGAAKHAFPAWARLTFEQRNHYLLAWAKALRDHEAELIGRLSREVGKPLWEARQEIANVQNKFQLTEKSVRELLAGFTASTANPRVFGECAFKPRGVLAVFSPFNFPLHLAMGHILPALATGNTVVLKPSELTPAVSALLAKTAVLANLPPGVFNLVQGNAIVGQELVTHPDVRGILFTGSYAVGQLIRTQATTDPGKIVVLEMGGKNASVLWDDAQLITALPAILQSAFITCGQRCTATSRLLVHERLWDAARRELPRLAAQLTVGDPLEDKAFLGPIISEAAKARVETYEQRAWEAGLRPLLEKPLALPAEGSYVSPLIHEIRGALDPFADEEIFGPTLTLQAVHTLSDAIAQVEQSRYGLAAAIYTKSRDTYEEFFRGVTAGVINWNRPTTGSSSALPFGGQKASGNQFPTAYWAVYYATYPVARMIDADAQSIDRYPGFPEYPAP